MAHDDVAAPLTGRQSAALATIAWGMAHFGSLLTTRQLPRARVLTLVRRGLARSAGLVTPCDGDGFLTDATEREGFMLTERGLDAVAASDPEHPDLPAARARLAAATTPTLEPRRG